MSRYDDQALLEAVRTHRERLRGAFLFGSLGTRRSSSMLIGRLIGSVVAGAVAAAVCAGVSFAISVLPAQATPAPTPTPGAANGMNGVGQ